MDSTRPLLRRLLRRAARDVVLPIAVAVGLALTVQAAVAKPYEIPTSSMKPAINEGDRIIANRLIYRFRDVARGDIIVFDTDEAVRRDCGLTATTPFVKRVVGVAGDAVEVIGGRTLVNGAEFVVPHAARPSYEKRFSIVPDGSVLVLGDNRNNSCDSHSWSHPFVPTDAVIGEAEIGYWPPRSVRMLH